MYSVQTLYCRNSRTPNGKCSRRLPIMCLSRMSTKSTTMSEVSQSYKKSESKRLIEIILMGVGGFVVGGLTVGTVAWLSGK